MGGTIDSFFAVKAGLPLVNVAAMFQTYPAVLPIHRHSVVNQQFGMNLKK